MAACEVCGAQMRPHCQVGVCTRTEACVRERRRRWSQEIRKRNHDRVHVYAILFPDGWLKVGKCSGAFSSAEKNASDRHEGKARAPKSRVFWAAKGDERHEAAIQAALSFIFPQVFYPGDFGNRISEWFDASSVSQEALANLLTYIYHNLPDHPGLTDIEEYRKKGPRSEPDHSTSNHEVT